MDFNGRELQMLSMGLSSIEDTRLDLNEFVKFMRDLSFQDDAIDTYCYIRGLKREVIDRLKCFMYDDDVPSDIIPKHFKHESYGLFKHTEYGQEFPIFKGRFVIPVADTRDNIAGFVGWCDDYKEMGGPKYLDSLNYGYKSKYSGFLGMQFLEDYYKGGEIVVCEGPVCWMYMLGQGLPAVCSLGSRLYFSMIQILSRFGYKCLIIPDGTYADKDNKIVVDDAGYKYRKQVKYDLPNARCVQPTLAKDIDDSRKVLNDQGKDGDQIIAQEIRMLLQNPFYTSPYFV